MTIQFERWLASTRPMIWRLPRRHVWRKASRVSSVSYSEARLGACGRKIEQMDNPKQERRNEARRRRRALKRARITFKGRWETIDCTALNLSNLGACR